jgi:hypothetical protein
MVSSYNYSSGPSQQQQQQQNAYMDSEMTYSPMDEKPPSGLPANANGFDSGSSHHHSNLNPNSSGSANVVPNGAVKSSTASPSGPPPGMSTNFVGKL